MFIPKKNDTFTVDRLVTTAGKKDFSNTIITELRVYSYEVSDEYRAIHGITGGEEVKKFMTKFSDIGTGDRITDRDGNYRIVNKQVKRYCGGFYEYLMTREYD